VLSNTILGKLLRAIRSEVGVLYETSRSMDELQVIGSTYGTAVSNISL
jgi:hypothetical protein